MPGRFLPRKATEAQIESAIMQRLTLGGAWAEKTDAGQIGRGGKRGSMVPGFPDLVAILPLPGSRWALVALIECKTDVGRLNVNQIATHARLRACGIQPVVMRSQDDVPDLLAEGRQLRERLKP